MQEHDQAKDAQAAGVSAWDILAKGTDDAYGLDSDEQAGDPDPKTGEHRTDLRPARPTSRQAQDAARMHGSAYKSDDMGDGKDGDNDTSATTPHNGNKGGAAVQSSTDKNSKKPTNSTARKSRQRGGQDMSGYTRSRTSKRKKSNKNDSGDHTVSKVTGIREIDGKLEYHIILEDYSSEFDQWIREDQATNCAPP